MHKSYRRSVKNKWLFTNAPEFFTFLPSHCVRSLHFRTKKNQRQIELSLCLTGTVTWQTSLVLSSTCQSDASKFQRSVTQPHTTLCIRKFRISSFSNTLSAQLKSLVRTVYTTLRHTASGFCVHPLSGTPISSTTAIMWKDDCSEDRLRLDFLKLQGW